MSVDGVADSGVISKLTTDTAPKPAERREGGKAFGEVLEKELESRSALDEGSPTAAATPGFSTFPVYEVSALDGLPETGDLRERGIRDTEQLIDILDRYRQNLDRDRIDPDKMKETVQVLDRVSRDMMEYVNQVDHAELADLMQESLVMARVEVEKFTRGDYNS
ncbi:MAG: hypothetical protein GXO34_00795 [Deltaproteobacteria bacterium]|nr:hypothetical protein [Deltaproteobacteria bacterium]